MIRGTIVNSSWTLLSRILGFARDALMAATLGVTPLYGAFSIAWLVPNLFRKLFGEGAVGAAIQPALARTRQQSGEPAARLLFSRFHGFLTLVLLGLLVTSEAVVWVWYLLLPEDGAVATRQALILTGILLPYVLPICLTALLSAPQHLSGRFTFPAAAPVVLNLAWIGALLWWRRSEEMEAWDGLLWLCIAILFGGFMQWLIQAPGMRLSGYSLRPRFQPGDGTVRATYRSFLPALLGLAAVQINMALDQLLVWQIVGPEANPYAYLANRLLQLPLALISIAAATATLPLFARLSAEGKLDELSLALRRAGEATLLLMVAAGAGLGVLARPAVSVLFEHGRFDAENSAVLAHTLQAYLWCLPGASLGAILARARQSCGDFKGPARIAIAVVPLNLVLDLVLLPRYGVAGAGYATAVALTVQAGLLLAGLPDLGIRRPLAWKRLPLVLIPGVCAAAGAALCARSLGALAYTLPGVLACIAAGVAIATALTAVLLPEDFRLLLRTLRGRTGR